MADGWTSLIDTFEASRAANTRSRPPSSSGLRGWDALMAPPSRPSSGGGQRAPGGRFSGDLREGILETAAELDIDPVDLATVISFETAGTFSPTQRGPTTQWGQHRGLIQFGEPQAKRHGVDWNDALGSQLGANGAIVNYLRSSGFKNGMSGLDLYSTVNAGAPGLYSRSDANNGGTRGDVADKWNNQMGGHRRKAEALMGMSAPSPRSTDRPAFKPGRLWLDLGGM
jgi:hypothetical protein